MSLNEFITSGAFANFLKEMQTRFFFVCGGALLFCVFYRKSLSLDNPSILANQTAVSGMFIANILAFAFLLYLFALIADLFFECKKDSYLSFNARKRAAIKASNKSESLILLKALKFFSINNIENKKFVVNDADIYSNLRNNGFLDVSGGFDGEVNEDGRSTGREGAHWEITINHSLIKYLFENPRFIKILKEKCK